MRCSRKLARGTGDISSSGGISTCTSASSAPTLHSNRPRSEESRASRSPCSHSRLNGTHFLFTVMLTVAVCVEFGPLIDFV
jgi:hypothetical protein